MAKEKTYFVCRNCGAIQPKWMGKCPDCNSWDSLEQMTQAAADPHRPRALSDGEAASPLGTSAALEDVPARPISEIPDFDVPRMPTGLSEFDRVLGGGIVPNSAVLLGGDPGIGKSTLLLQAGDRMARQGHRVLYVSSEESASQTKLRARRLGVGDDHLLIYAQTNLEKIGRQIQKLRPHLCVIDSVQMIYEPTNAAPPGSISQLRDCATELVYLAKAGGTAVCLVGHVTKQGLLAGPKLLEHIVDTVLYFEGDTHHDHRIVRCVKNRHGNTLEVGLFRMGLTGLENVPDASALLIEPHAGSPPGSVICAVTQGSRVLALEIQALTTDSMLGSTRRKVSGCDANRVAMIIAVLEKRGGLRLADQDVFVNVVGGMRVNDPAADAAIALAIAGSRMKRGLSSRTLVMGELGLLGEFRQIGSLGQRISEAGRLGYSRLLVPIHRSEADKAAAAAAPPQIHITTCRTLEDALAALE
ncbi:MAG: DNA repair protein RadA [Planctomycetia bacterium]|jgi:DNA repair protein RadA/Sms|nr:DNA repair protein RadA [Planctomycetia bacterium]